MCGFGYKKKERKALNSSLYSLTHRNARTIKLVSLRVRHIHLSFFVYNILFICCSVAFAQSYCSIYLPKYFVFSVLPFSKNS